MTIEWIETYNEFTTYILKSVFLPLEDDMRQVTILKTDKWGKKS